MTTLAQRSFAGGELAPALHSRCDEVKYATGARTLRNYFIMKHGGAASRAGTQFIAEVKDSTKAVRIIPFIFNSDQTYTIEFGDQYIRFVKNGAQITNTNRTISGVSQANPAVVTTSTAHGFTTGMNVAISGLAPAIAGNGMDQLNFRVYTATVLSSTTFSIKNLDGTNVNTSAFGAYVSGGIASTINPQAISGITKANPAVVTSAVPHGLSTGNEVVVSGVLGMTEVNSRNFRVTVLSSTTFSLQNIDGTNVDSSGYGTYTSGGSLGQVLELSTSYAAADLFGLKLVQSADVISIAHPNYSPRELKRYADNLWSIADILFIPSVSAPTGLSATNPGSPITGGVTYNGVNYLGNSQYGVTAVGADGDESFMSVALTTQWCLPTTVSWTASVGAIAYNIYRNYGGIFAYVGSSAVGSTSFIDLVTTPDITRTPPQAGPGFVATTGDAPTAITYFQQRLILANSKNAPETTWASRSGRFKNFTKSFPTQDDDSIKFNLAGRQVNSIQHLVDMGRLIILTSGGELSALGNSNGVLTPTGINTKQYSYHGAGPLQPVIIGSNLIYQQARGSIVRNLTYSFQIDGFNGTDLTVFSSHLFEGYSLVDWTYAQTPNSILWAVRSDGTLIGMTYIDEQQIWGWHRHDFDGSVESVCAIPEGTEDALYLVIRRTVNGRSVRYIERMYSRFISNIVDFCAMDAALKYDGRNTSSTTMTLSGGTGSWDYTQNLTLTASSSSFKASDVGSQIFLDVVDANGKRTNRIRLSIRAYTSATVVTVRSDKNVPAGLQSTATTNWTHAVKTLGNLSHIEGKKVSVFADGFVVASANNPEYDAITVTNGSITLDRPYGVISVGLPITSDIETLDIDTPQGESIADKKKNISRVTARVQASRGLWAGGRAPSDDTVDPLEGLEEAKIRQDEEYDDPVSLLTDTIQINIQPQWNSNGRVFLRQIDPIPVSILAVYPAGNIPIGRG